MKKVKLPEFFGFDPQGWIQKATLYFNINRTPDNLRLRLAQLSMVGVAQHWFTVITQVRESLSWADFQSELLQGFSGLEIHNPYEQLATVQSDSIHDYIDDFEYLMSLVPRLPES
ncbi:putative retrotransposon gag domain-containing protein [Helianthus annuus]|nr:putative retrotransposon gag domain-containing protein [Helianthus annuus]